MLERQKSALEAFLRPLVYWNQAKKKTKAKRTKKKKIQLRIRRRKSFNGKVLIKYSGGNNEDQPSLAESDKFPPPI